MAETKLVEAKHLKKGNYVMINDASCRVTEVLKSAPGKHGHLKLRVTGVGLVDEKKRVLMCPGHEKVDSPIVDKRTCQILSVQAGTAQAMDMETYETFDIRVPSNLANSIVEGGECSYWVLAGEKVLMEVKG